MQQELGGSAVGLPGKIVTGTDQLLRLNPSTIASDVEAFLSALGRARAARGAENRSSVSRKRSSNRRRRGGSGQASDWPVVEYAARARAGREDDRDLSLAGFDALGAGSCSTRGVVEESGP
jgi:hypothetical protein